MAPSEEASNIRVFVHWHEQTVFAGEEVKCTITFKNVAPDADKKTQDQDQNHSDRHRLTSALAARAQASVNLSTSSSATVSKGHRRSALSLSGPSLSTHGRAGSVQWPAPGVVADGRSSHVHKRSVSIVSIGSVNTVDEAKQKNDGPLQSRRQGGGHNRATSLQIPPRGNLSPLAGPHSASFSPRQNSSPTINASYPPDRFGRMIHGSRSASGPRRSPRTSPNIMPEFRFPAFPPPPGEQSPSPDRPSEADYLSPGARPILEGKGTPPRASERPAVGARILSGTSLVDGTPRNSADFYALSNNSSETMASEYVQHPPQRPPLRRSHLRRSSVMTESNVHGPEALMMGYVQIQGSFLLDGSLVSLGPFETVKKQAVVGGRGGGVVGLGVSKQRDSGLLRNFGWSNISTSLGDLLGGGELSTIREMRGVANSKSIPLLSTPQSILFVDLQLAPGQSRSFEYSTKLPRGLPPTHKGKVMKTSYSLVIGTQRAGGVKEQQVRSVEAPFRVLGGVNSVGDILGHDLMSPYVLLRDEAQVKSGNKNLRSHKNKAPSSAPATFTEFLGYVDELIARRRNELGGGLLSPSIMTTSRRPSAVDDTMTAREAIRLAILRSNMTADGQQSQNRFVIARSGLRVGVVMLTRPYFKLGEVVTMVVDLTDAEVPCYAVHMTLETSEKVDPSLAVRSEVSIQRVTRKVYVTSSDTTLFSRRVVFTPTIPISATPEFYTSGVSLDWKIRVEFVVPSRNEDFEGNHHRQSPSHHLLEQISKDERGGLVLAAVENLTCESFDVSVPLRVYGAVGSGLERLERDETAVDGLAI